MQEPADRPLLAEIREELDTLTAELREMAAARWELAQLELAADVQSVKRLAILWLAAALMALTALPLLAVYLAELLDGCGHIARAGWLLILGAGLLSSAAAAAWLAWRRFRRCFVGLQETREELREDLLWLREKREGGGKKGKGGRGKAEEEKTDAME